MSSFQALILVWPGKSVLKTEQNGNQLISDLKELNQSFLWEWERGRIKLTSKTSQRSDENQRLHPDYEVESANRLEPCAHGERVRAVTPALNLLLTGEGLLLY